MATMKHENALFIYLCVMKMYILAMAAICGIAIEGPGN